MTLLAPAAAIVITLCVLAWSMQRVETELAALRHSLRRSRAAGVAVSELQRDSVATMIEAQRIDATARARADLRRSRRRSGRR